MRAYSCVPGKRKATSRQISNRSGNIVVFTAILMMALMALLALSVDVGYVATMQPELQRPLKATAPPGVMQQVAGTRFNVPGSSSSFNMYEQLDDACEEIAKSWALSSCHSRCF